MFIFRRRIKSYMRIEQGKQTDLNVCGCEWSEWMASNIHNMISISYEFTFCCCGFVVAFFAYAKILGSSQSNKFNTKLYIHIANIIRFTIDDIHMVNYNRVIWNNFPNRNKTAVYIRIVCNKNITSIASNMIKTNEQTEVIITSDTKYEYEKKQTKFVLFLFDVPICFLCTQTEIVLDTLNR